jgi:hypothetical protein
MRTKHGIVTADPAPSRSGSRRSASRFAAQVQRFAGAVGLAKSEPTQSRPSMLLQLETHGSRLLTIRAGLKRRSGAVSEETKTVARGCDGDAADHREQHEIRERRWQIEASIFSDRNVGNDGRHRDG